MPHTTDSEYEHISVTLLASTFGAEITAVDFSKPVSPEVFAEIRHAITKVGNTQTLLRVPQGVD